MTQLRDRVVLITGGTGSFGRAYLQTCLQAGAKKVIILSRDEQKHFRLRSEIDDPRVRFFIGSVRDRNRLDTAFQGVDLVVHAAAMKHVALAEYDPIEAVRTNVDGSVNVIEMAIRHNVRKVVFLSTDKAVAPANLYGATKLCAERLFVAANTYAPALGTRFAVVRYGNVMGSAGSILPIFKELCAKGEWLTLTDARMTRFLISMDDACALVTRAFNSMQGGETYVPKLPSVRIEDLAEAVLAVHNPSGGIKEVGIRPGEKLHETLVSEDEARRTVDIGGVYVIRPEYRKTQIFGEGISGEISSNGAQWLVQDQNEVTSIYKEWERTQ